MGWLSGLLVTPTSGSPSVEAPAGTLATAARGLPAVPHADRA